MCTPGFQSRTIYSRLPANGFQNNRMASGVIQLLHVTIEQSTIHRRPGDKGETSKNGLSSQKYMLLGRVVQIEGCSSG